MILLLNLLAFFCLFASSASCTTRASSRVARVENARNTLLSGTLPAGVELEGNQDIICEWKGYKECFGIAAENSRIKANYVSDNTSYKNIHFKDDDVGPGHHIEACTVLTQHDIHKTVTCYYVGSSSSNPISGLSSVEMSVKEPATCGVRTITLTESELDMATAYFNNYINKVPSVTNIYH